MGQKETLTALKALCKIHKEKWYTSREIIKYMKANKLANGSINGIYSDLMRLAEWELIEIRGVGIWEHHKEFKTK